MLLTETPEIAKEFDEKEDEGFPGLCYLDYLILLYETLKEHGIWSYEPTRKRKSFKER